MLQYLAVELIAMAQYQDEQPERLYGAVTVGDMWRFGLLECRAKRIVKDIDSFRIPLDLEQLFQVFLGILQPATPSTNLSGGLSEPKASSLGGGYIL